MSEDYILHFISLNAQGLRDSSKRSRLMQWMSHQNVKIIYLQETHFSEEIKLKIDTEFSSWQCYHSFGNSRSRGVSIFLHNSLNAKMSCVVQDNDGRYLLLNILINQDNITMVNIYAHNDDKLRDNFFKSLLYLVKEKSSGTVIIGGDFNEVLNVVDRIPQPNRFKYSKSLAKLISDLNLNDVWRTKNINTSQFTWRRKNSFERSRIDYWLLNEDIIPSISSCDIRPALIQYTDHLAISLKLCLKNNRGTGTWKFNNSLLDDETFTKNLNLFIDTFNNNLQYMDADPQIVWEILKIEIKEFTLKHSKQKAKARNSYLSSLEKEISILQTETNVDKNMTQYTQERLIFLEKEIENIYSYKAKGAMIRSRIQIIEEGEKCTNFFLGLEKSRQARKSIQSLRVNGQLLTERDDILRAEADFYSNLYSKGNINTENIDEYLENIDTPVLKENCSCLCEGYLSVNECFASLKDMKFNKSPGSDGFTVEFYLQFWPKLGSLVVNSLNCGYDKKQLSSSQKNSILSLIYKKGDPEDLENWRPISLLNIDYKIATRCLSKRLQKVLPDLISPDQQGYIKGRYIGYNIRQIQDIIDYADLLEINGAILFLDFKKAFDTVEHPFMFKVIRKFGFGNSFIQWLETFYSDITTCIYNNGWRSNLVHPSRGLKQGCSLSALIFILVAEILATKLKTSCDFKGIIIENSNEQNNCLKLSQLADDTTVFVKDKTDAKIALKIVDEFSLHSGLTLNRKKTECLWIGSSKNCVENIGNIKCAKTVKALGITFGYDIEYCDKSNWEKPIRECTQAIQAWKRRHLTFYGKIIIIKTLLLPKFVYMFHSLTVPDKVKHDIDKLLFDFLWDGKREKIKRKTLIGTKLNGGLNMIDIESFLRSIKLKWIKTLLHEDGSNWKIIPRKLLNQFGKNLLIFNMNVKSLRDLPKTEIRLTPFYINVLNAYFEFSSLEPNFSIFPLKFVEIRKQLLWGNKHIRFRGKTLIFKSWINSDILFLNDIIGQSGCLDETKILGKLKNKTNWISQVNIIKKAVPGVWKGILKSRESKLTVVNATLKLTFNRENSLNMNNKDFYRTMLDNKFIKPYVHRKWNNTFHNDINWKDFYTSLEMACIDNRIKQFKFKLIHDILATKQNLFKWKIETNPNCNICKVVEDYEHFFITCKAVRPLWERLLPIFRLSGFENNLQSLKTLIIGYNITNKCYNDVNMIFNLIGFCIYKGYYISDKKMQIHSVENLFIKEYRFLYTYLSSKNKLSTFLVNFNRYL